MRLREACAMSVFVLAQLLQIKVVIRENIMFVYTTFMGCHSNVLPYLTLLPPISVGAGSNYGGLEDYQLRYVEYIICAWLDLVSCT